MQLHPAIASDSYLVDFAGKASNALALQIELQAAIDAVGVAIPLAEIVSVTLRGAGNAETWMTSFEASALTTGAPNVVLAVDCQVQCFQAGTLEGLRALVEGAIAGDPGFPVLGAGGVQNIWVTDYAGAGAGGSAWIAVVVFSAVG